MNSFTRRIYALAFVALLIALTQSCSHPQPVPQTKEPPSRPSAILVDVKPGGPLVVTTSDAAFEVSPNGYVQAFLLRDGQRLTTLDDPQAGKPSESDYIQQAERRSSLHSRLRSGQSA